MLYTAYCKPLRPESILNKALLRIGEQKLLKVLFIQQYSVVIALSILMSDNF
jgi:hypothetical protein